MLLRHPLTVLIDAAGQAMRALARILGRIGAGRRHRAAADQTLAALAERFPGAPEHWLRFIAEQVPALAQTGDMAALRMPGPAEPAAMPEPRRMPSPRRVDPARAAGTVAAPETHLSEPSPAPSATPAGPRRRAALLRLEPASDTPAKAPSPAVSRARAAIRMVRPEPAAAARRPEAVRSAPAPSRPDGIAGPSPQADAAPHHAVPAGKGMPQPRAFAAGQLLSTPVRSEPEEPRREPPAARIQGRDALPESGAAPTGYRRGAVRAAPLPDPVGRRQPSGPRAFGDIGQAPSAPDGPARRDRAFAPSVPPAAADRGAGWMVLAPAGREARPATDRDAARTSRAEGRGRDPLRPDWPSLPSAEPAPIVDAHVDPSRLDRLRQEQEVGLWNA
ncbi:hypothetical protein [Inquilinus sp.]|jgi:hypothetical protein|uniref:hypothetical protein n=1 Tax=Inquilinus sp. TaxID=1932117 RepID=UPI00378366AC